jgi:hypothetical protein
MSIDDRSGPDRFSSLFFKPIGADDNGHDCAACRSIVKSTSTFPHCNADAIM